MDRNKFNIKGMSILRYAIFLLAFMCCGFAFNSKKVDAAPVIAIPYDSDYTYNNTLTFYIGYDVLTVNKVEYTLGDGRWHSFDNPESSYSAIYKDKAADSFCSGKSYFAACTSVIMAYTINDLSGNGLTVNSSGKFTITVSSSNKSGWFGGDSESSRTLTYDGTAPSVSKVELYRNDTSSSKTAIIGNKIKFNVTLSEPSYVYSGVKVNFKIGSSEKSASCDTSSSSAVNSFSCHYTIASGDSGSFSFTNLTGTNNIEDIYDNSMGSSSSASFSNPNSITVDGIKPTVINVESIDGTYSSAAPVQVQVTFSETLSAASGSTAPTMKVKFGDGSERTCFFNSSNANKLLYLCSPSESDQGAMSFVSLSGGSGFSDAAGNALNLSYSSKDFGGVIVDNNLPAISSLTVEPTGCKSENGEVYCKGGNTIKVVFKFNMHVTFSSESISLKFGGVDSKNTSFTSRTYDQTTKTLELVYTVNNQDNGALSVTYNLSLKGNNALTNTASNTKSNFNVFVDNSVPTIGEVEVSATDGDVKEKVVYGTSGMVVKFDIAVNESSKITFDKSKVILVDRDGNAISIDKNGKMGVSAVSSSISGKTITVLVTISGEYKGIFKIKVAKAAIKDSFGSSLANDFYSELYTVDTKAPEFNVEIIYPEYKGYNLNNEWALISGSEVQYKITSADVELKDFCVYEMNESGCMGYEDIELNVPYLYSFEKSGDGDYSFNVTVRDEFYNAKNLVVKFKFKEMFAYSNGESTNAKSHTISSNVSMFAKDSVLKYGWFKSGQSVSFASANTTSKQDDVLSIDGSETFNGEYRVCIQHVESSIVLCSEYVKFDTKIDSFSVDVANAWENSDLATTITFNDLSTIKCIAIGKNESNVNCDKTSSPNVTIYRTSQAISPLKKYTISENGIYYFYIEDAVGNSALITKTITTIDKEDIKIEVFNGKTGEYNTNLELGTYKSEHSFLVTFDKDALVGSDHSLYKYFFATEKYSNINTKDAFNAYYLNSAYRQEITNCNKSLLITTPKVDGIHHLYIMAVDESNNVSFKIINDIKVDSSGPVIKMYDAQNNEVYGGSSSYIAVFDYSIVIEDKDSKLNLNKITYRWVNLAGDTVLENSYDGCGYDYNTCKISGSEIEFKSDVFSPTDKYKFQLTAFDNAGNSSTFISNEFLIDTTAPVVVINVDENKWYENGNISFTVSKQNNGTWSSIAYCLNDCFLEDNSYDMDKFKLLSVSNSKVIEKVVNLTLKNGINVLYVYASDMIGNYTYEKANIKYDSQNSEITVNGLNEDGVIDLTGSDELNFSFTINDEVSGVAQYCVYYNGDASSKTCYDALGNKEVSKVYDIERNGIYTIEVTDVSGNEIVYNVSVIGIDTEPIEFDLVTDAKEGNFVNGDVLVSIVNMRKFMVEEVEERVANIDYIVLPLGSIISGNEETLFSENSVNVVYDKENMLALINSFEVSENKLYVVRIVDTAGNVSYKSINVTCIDRDNPFINTNKYPNNEDRIYVTTSSGNNLRVFVKEDQVSKVYKYSNDVIMVVFGSDSLKDLSTGYNNSLALKVCFEEVDCVYNTYNVTSTVVEGYVTNNAISIKAPYNFSGNIKYYLIDGAGNSSEPYSFEVEYQNEISEISLTVKDAGGAAIEENSKYSKVVVSLEGEEVNDIITNNGAKYALIKSSINMHNQLINNNSTISSFLTSYGFVNVTNKTFEVSKNNVDDSYYLWVYVIDLLGNTKLIKSNSIIKIDTIVPSFGDLTLDISKIDSTNYHLAVDKFDDEYELYIDTNNDGAYEKVNFEDNQYEFEVTGLDSINFKLVDEAGNVIIQSFSLNVASKVYAKVYQVGNTREANIVIYNLGNKNVTSFRYIVTDIDSGLVYDEVTINDDNIPECRGFESTCKGSISSHVKKGIYNLSLINFNKDKKVIFYIYVDGVLIDLVEKNIMEDRTPAEITFEQGNPNIISTVNGKNYEFNISVKEDNLSSLVNNRYILTTASNVNDFNSMYEMCTNSDVCARGVYDLNSDLEGVIEINSNASKFSNLITGTYYLYVYIADDFGNVKVSKSSEVYVDNETPVVQYSLKNSSYTFNDINEEVYVSAAAKLKLTDNYKVKYLEVYKDGSISAVCYIEDASKDTNCIRNSAGEIGLSVENGIVYYYLDNGNYIIKVYDTADNVRVVAINIDGSDPVISLYKKVGENYENQLSDKKLYSDLTNLYLSVEDNNFNYLTIDLENTITHEFIITASRYSYNSDIGTCLVGRDECEYGVKLVDLIVGSTIQYNRITINVYDKANKSSSVVVNYDDSIPEIWTLDVGENIYIGGLLYVVKEDKTIDVEIGVNDQLSLDSLLNKVVLDVDGMNYYDAKYNELFKVSVYDSGNNLIDKDICQYVGSYTIKLNYTDGAGNDAVEKMLKVNVLDNTSPVIEFVDEIRVVEIKEDVTINGAIARDNYGLEINGNSIIKEKAIALSSASCEFESEGNDSCVDPVVKMANNVYRFMKSGEYKFTYTITDIAGNTTSVTQIIKVEDSVGPKMESTVDGKTTFELYFGAGKNGTGSIENITLNYPKSEDIGDDEEKSVEYVGLFALNNMNEKYKLDENMFVVSNGNNKITYLFGKVGTYYSRFSSTDSVGNVSIFEYEIKVIDNIAPVILGVSNNDVIKLGLEENFSVEYLINKYHITASDNYDLNVKIYYELKQSSTYSHEVVLKVSDSSNNSASITIFVNIEDHVAPIVGELIVDSQTNKNNLEFIVLGGSDNSGNWWHEYSIQGSAWVRIDENTTLQFGNDLSNPIEVCIHAVDAGGNVSLGTSCKTILVDTRKPTVKGVKDGDILSLETEVSVEDDRLESVEVWFNGEILDLTINDMPFKFSELGTYQLIAKDSLGNETVVTFMINIDVHMNIVNDINADQYIVNSIEFDKRFLVRVDVGYDSNGYSTIYTKLDGISINANDMLYILGNVPRTDDKFVIFSVNGMNIGNYSSGVNLIGNGINFKEGVNNEDCFVKVNDYYYAYVLIKENAYNGPVAVVDDKDKDTNDSKLLSGLIIAFGSIVVILIGYQIVKFRKRVRAA